MLYKAIYRKRKRKTLINPFAQRFVLRLPEESSVIVDLPDGKVSWKEIEKLAKNATPDGYDFVDVVEFHY